VLSNWVERKEEVSMEKVLNELENLALKELEGFDRGKVQAISSFVQAISSLVGTTSGNV
jgi:geranylgeranyl diphosphate synthase type II